MKTRYYWIWLLLITALLHAQTTEPVDLQMITRIKQEGLKNSQVMETLSYLTDVHGPRLTGSPNFMKAAEWCRNQLSEWGMANAQVEAWGTFGRGWEVQRYSAEMLAPQYMNIFAQPKAWTPGTDSVLSGEPLLIDTDEEDLSQYEGKLNGRIVLLGKAEDIEKKFEADASRLSAEDLAEKAQAPEPNARSGWMARAGEWRARRAKREKMSKFLVEQGVGAVLEASSIAHGTLRVMSGGSYKTAASNALPTLVIAWEHYNRIARLLEKEIPVQLEVNIRTRFVEDDSLGYNVIAEIPGVDKKLKNEVVMLGAHLDSWHGGTGATDNASGSAVMMEAVRILKALGVQPRRTIRIALWSGEEQGLHGSRNYVKNHFGDAKNGEVKPAHANVSAYFNIDNGGGKIRGIYLQENDAARLVFESYLTPFHDMGATTVSIQRTGSTDHVAFDEQGLPGFQFIQDPLDYFSRTWHTNMDVYDHVVEGDLMQMSVIVASIVYHTAMRDEKIPRKPMPGK